jgi:hypothetical protein
LPTSDSGIVISIGMSLYPFRCSQPQGLNRKSYRWAAKYFGRTASP